MNEADLKKVIDFIETYYNTHLTDNQILAINEELKGYTYDSFIENIKTPLLIAVDYFTVAGLHRIIENDKKADEYLKRSGKKSWNEFYANPS